MLRGEEATVWPIPRTPEAAAPPAQRSPLSDIAPPGMLIADDPAMAASTIAPKGGTPYQPNLHVDQAYEDFRRLMQPIEEQRSAVKRQVAANRSTLGNITQSHMDVLGNAITAIPSLAGDFLTYPFRRVRDFARNPSLPPSSPISDYMHDQTAPPIKSQDTPVFGAVPRVSVQDIAAGLRAASGDATFDQARHNIDVNEAARREVYPTSSAVGDITGTVETLGSLRAPFTEKLREFEYNRSKQVEKGKTMFESRPFKDKADARRVLLQSPGFQAILRGAGRTGEAGLEGATISLLQDQDPSSAAAFSAGVQATNSAGTEALMRKFTKLPSRVATFSVNAAILTGVMYAAGVVLPGSTNSTEAQKAAIHKMILGYTLGAGLSGVTTRARTGATSAYIPHLADALGSAPRNAMQKVLTDYVNSDQGTKQTLAAKIKFMGDNIGRFTDGQLNNLAASFNSGNLDRFYSELDKLQKATPQ
jgi:hypothetical protein